MNKTKVVISWSSGKDSALVLCRLQDDPNYEIVGLYTTYVGEEVPFQATPISIVEEQARLADLPLIKIALPQVFPSHIEYQQCVVQGLLQSGLEIDAVAFGDLFCNGIAEYRQSYIEPAGWQCLFPLLGERSSSLAREIIERGIQTRIITVDTTQLNGRFCGRWFDIALLDDLPENVDPCGENGEFHTLVVKAPCFHSSLSVTWQDIERQDRFHYLRYA